VLILVIRFMVSFDIGVEACLSPSSEHINVHAIILSKYHTRKHEALKHGGPLQRKSRPEREQIKREEDFHVI
jgi:hypothetical protein